jgi:SAM-dependent methyltransferase
VRASTLLGLARSGRLGVLRALGAAVRPYYRLCFLAGAARHRVLGLLASGPRSLEALASGLGIAEAHRAGLAEWLEVGVSLGELTHGSDGYALRGRLARALVRPEDDDVLALLEEMVDLHRRLLVETPGRLADGRPFTLADHDATVVARSSRTLEVFVREAIDGVLGADGSPRLLEIGCGSGTHLRHAASRCPGLRGVGLELHPAVADQARKNLAEWGLEDRFAIEVGDVRDRAPTGDFDLVTLHQNIYYFPVGARAALLDHVRGFLRPGGRLLLTTGCRGGSTAMAVLSLWAAATEGCGRLPAPDELEADLHAAGFERVRSHNHLAPLERFYSFVATNGAASPDGGVG